MRKTHEARKGFLEPQFTDDGGVTHPATRVRTRTLAETERLEALCRRLDASKVYRVTRAIVVRHPQHVALRAQHKGIGTYIDFEERTFEIETADGPGVALRLADIAKASQDLSIHPMLLDPRAAW